MSTLTPSAGLPERLTHGWSGRRRWPLISALGGLAAAVLVLLPLAFLLVQARQSGWSVLWHLLDRHSVAVLLWNSVRLALACTALCAIIGVGAAWLVQRSDVPWRGFWAVVLVLPLGIPDFVVGFGWISIAPGLHGYLAAVMIMTLSLYPLVYLPVAGAMARLDASLIDASRSLGLSPLQSFVRVTLRQVWPAVLGGCLLVTLGLLAEYGAFEIVQYQTFTVQIFTEFKLAFDAEAACALSLVLVLIGIVVLAGELTLGGRGRIVRSGPGARREPARVRLGHRRWAALAALLAVAALALGVPVGSLVYWMTRGNSSTLPATSLLAATGHTAEYSALAALLATALAVPIATLALRHRNRLTILLERLSYLPMALPGLVIALGLVAFTVRYAFSLYQSAFELIVAYAILFLPLALVGVRSAMASAPPALEEVARSLGQRPTAVFARVTLPLIAPGLGAAFALVFVSSATELTATLLLRPTGVDTLATQFWTYTSNFSYGAAAPYAGMMVAISAIPAYLLSTRMQKITQMGRGR